MCFSSEFRKQKVSRDAGVALKDAVVGDACDLSRESDRVRAVEEALRVIKPGGILACSPSWTTG